MKKIELNVPTLLKFKLIDYWNDNYHTKDFTPKNKELLVNSSLDLWSYILNYSIRTQHSSKKYGNILSSTLEKRYRVNNGTKRIRYTGILKSLIDTQSIEVNDTYSTGKFSKSYRITDQSYNLLERSSFNLPEDPRDKLQHKSRIDHLNSFAFISYYQEIKPVINYHYDSQINWKELLVDLEYQKTLGEINDDEWFLYKNEALKYNQQFFYFSRPTPEGRFYSSLTSLPKKVRKHLYLDCLPTCEIDLRNAVPFFLSHIVDDKLFRQHTSQGIFYDYIADKLKKSRTFAKEFVFQIFFGKRRSKIFNNIYPHLQEKIWEIGDGKVIFEKTSEIEASIFVPAFPFPALPIHDCLLVRNIPNDIRPVKELTSRFLDKGLSYPPLNSVCG